MFGARPRSLDPEQLPLAELLVAFGGAILGNASGRDDVQQTVVELRDAGQARALVDQAKGILMHARGGTAEEALAELRASAHAQDIDVTEAARRVIASPATEAG
jgi:AmiR/NasT family two-component response regulator